jgi:hypothetical protein
MTFCAKRPRGLTLLRWPAFALPLKSPEFALVPY